MQNKNKQYRIEKGLLLFTQPKSPYFYGKIRMDGKYLTKSFAPITDLEIAKEKLYEWKESLSSSENIHSNLQQHNLRDEYIAVSLYTSPSPRDRTRSRMPSSA